MKVMTADGKEMDLSPLEKSDSFALGQKAAEKGWGQEGALQKNGPLFRLGWLTYENRDKVQRISSTKDEVLELFALAKQEDEQRVEICNDKLTGIHYVFLNPIEPLAGRTEKEFHPQIPSFAVSLSQAAIKKEEAIWAENGRTTFRVDFPINQDAELAHESLKGYIFLSPEEEWVLRWLKENSERWSEEDGHNLRAGALWQLFLKGITAERLWRSLLEDGTLKKDKPREL